MLIRNYPKSLNIPHKYLSNLWQGTTYAQEKIDGSQISFGVINGVLQAKSKRRALQMDEGHTGMFRAGVLEILEIQHLLTPGWTYRGEYLGKLKHNVLTYGSVPPKHIVLFDIETVPEEQRIAFLPPAEVERHAIYLGLLSAPILAVFSDKPSEDDLDALLETTSVLGDVLIEGLVLKNYAHLDVYGDLLMGKYVSPKFREVHGKKKRVAKGSAVGRVVDMYTTDARWAKAIQHLTEQGTLSGEMKDIPLLLREIHRDVQEENADEIKEELFSVLWPEIKKGITRGFPEYYREYLET